MDSYFQELTQAIARPIGLVLAEPESGGNGINYIRLQFPDVFLQFSFVILGMGVLEVRLGRQIVLEDREVVGFANIPTPIQELERVDGLYSFRKYRDDRLLQEAFGVKTPDEYQKRVFIPANMLRATKAFYEELTEALRRIGSGSLNVMDYYLSFDQIRIPDAALKAGKL